MDFHKHPATDKNNTPSTPPEAHDTPIPPEDDDGAELSLMEQLMQDPAHDYRKLRYGDTIEGMIMRIDREGILVDIGAKSEGVVPTREMQSLTDEERNDLEVGTNILVFVLQTEEKEGQTVLSLDKAREERSWRSLQELYDKGTIVEASVVNYNKGGLLVALDTIRGFVPASQIGTISRSSDSQKQSDMARMIGQVLQLKIIEIDRNRNRLILSERQAEQEAREERKEELLETLNEGHICPGTITSLCDFGAFVDIGGADGLVHLSELSWGRVRHPTDVVKVGQQVEVYVLSIDRDRKRIALSLKRTQQEPWATVAERYHLGQIVDGTITQLTPFGAFARIEDGVECLIHISEMGDRTVRHPEQLVSEGQVVQARIIRIDPTRKRMGLSLCLSPNEPPESQEDSADDD